MAAMFTDDPNELNNRYMPKDNGMYEDDEEYIPEEELTEEEREMIKTVGSFTAKDWKMIIEWIRDEEDYTLSREEYDAKVILGKLNVALKLEGEAAYQFRLSLANRVEPKQAVLILERLKKKPEEGVNIPQDILDIIYAKAKEYKG